MADYDGPTYDIVAGTAYAAEYQTNGHWVPYWTTQPTYAPIAFGSGGSGSTPSGQDINGYGYGQSG